MSDNYECDNCEWIGDREDAVDAEDLSMRLEPGCTYTDKECPECGALAYPEAEAVFQWIVDRPPTEEDADHFGEVYVALNGGRYQGLKWDEVASGFVRPWAPVKAVPTGVVDSAIHARTRAYGDCERWGGRKKQNDYYHYIRQ